MTHEVTVRGQNRESYLNSCSVVVLVALVSMDQVKCSDRARPPSVLHHRSSGDPFQFSATRFIVDATPFVEGRLSVDVCRPLARVGSESSDGPIICTNVQPLFS
jgi:hypothetical protein